MFYNHKGLSIARSILLLVTFTTTTAAVVLMIVQFALGIREKNGYISSFSQEAENGKRRTYYRITDSGKSYYKEKCEEWQLTKDVIERFISDAQ